MFYIERFNKYCISLLYCIEYLQCNGVFVKIIKNDHVRKVVKKRIILIADLFFIRMISGIMSSAKTGGG